MAEDDIVRPFRGSLAEPMTGLYWNARGQIACFEHARQQPLTRRSATQVWMWRPLDPDGLQADLLRFFFARQGDGEQVECEWCVVRCADCRAVLSAEDRERGYDFCLACSRLESTAQNPNE